MGWALYGKVSEMMAGESQVPPPASPPTSAPPLSAHGQEGHVVSGSVVHRGRGLIRSARERAAAASAKIASVSTPFSAGSSSLLDLEAALSNYGRNSYSCSNNLRSTNIFFNNLNNVNFYMILNCVAIYFVFSNFIF